MAKAIHSSAELAAAGLIATTEQPQIDAVSDKYAIAISSAVLRTINRSDPQDPIARQYVPSARELQATDKELLDPIGDAAHSPLPGLVHRYPDRVLLKPTLVCPVYCRFCFRREMVGNNANAPLSEAQLDDAFDYIASHPQIWEVIISGGDPLAMSERRLAQIVRRLRSIEHVRVLRFHSRVPVATPERITESLVNVLANANQTTYVMVHANHVNELSEAARTACAKLLNGGVTLMSQTVLLKGVNDTEQALAELMRGFVETRIVPYYLHHPDLAPGSAHFRVSIAEGQRLIKALRGRYSGLCQPQYVIDIPGGHGKSSAAATMVKRVGEQQGQEQAGSYLLEDYKGNQHPYQDDCSG